MNERVQSPRSNTSSDRFGHEIFLSSNLRNRLSWHGIAAVEAEQKTATPSFWESFRRLTWVQIVFRTVFCIFFQPVAACWQAARDRNSLRPRDKRYAIGNASNPGGKRDDPANELRVFFGTKERSALRDNLNRQITRSAGTTQPPPSALNHDSTVSVDARENTLKTIKHKFPSPNFQPAFDAIFSEETEASLKQLIERELSLPMGNVRYSVRYQLNREEASDSDTHNITFGDKSSLDLTDDNSKDFFLLPETCREITLEIDILGDHENEHRADAFLPSTQQATAAGKLIVRLTADGEGSRIRVISLDAHRK